MNPIHFYIVIPVYKAEKYLPECLNSVLSQTYPHFTAIAVDDGSPDRSGDICDEYAARDSRIHVIHQQNSGSFAARAAGIRWCLENGSDGSFLMSLDSDDCFYPNALQTVHDTICMHHCDLVLFRSDWNYRGKIYPASNTEPPWEGFPESKKQFYHLVFSTNGYNALWAKAISVKLISEKQLDEPVLLHVSEDLMQSIPFYQNSTLPYFLSDALLQYNYRPDSASNCNTYEHFINPLPVYRIIWETMEKEGVWEKEDYAKYARHCHGILNETIWRIARMRTSYANKAVLFDELARMPIYRTILDFSPQKELLLSLFSTKQYFLLHVVGSICKTLGDLRRFIRGIKQK